ncbi:PqiB family protein [Pararhodospirillum oryzae]|uniref:Paraquat-inducible protein n=1 Tax=Pararhodospirillum oryzae TaxID=478448 RepID=A0A512H3U0_9PROT|nr:MlaD family protein [Pararhodospirillum oryzae]GEO80107.1 paraquat-inducible protein [Pararhodospirillum oryzae]
MTEPSLPLAPAEPVLRPPRSRRPSLIWLVPLAAALTGLGLVVQTMMARGPSIVVQFDTATGIEAGKTKVKVKDVEIGEVSAVRLSDDLSHVLVSVDLVRDARGFAAVDSRFWVVRPRLAGSGISGLDTLLSGAYIGAERGHSSATGTHFVGLEAPPVVAWDVPGRRFTLKAEDLGSLDAGSPVFFRRIPVGQVEHFSLDSSGDGLTMGVFIKAPYDRFVTTATRFWHASGVDLTVDARGVRLDTQSLATILMGGVAFEAPPEQGDAPPADPGSTFTLASSRATAMEAVDSRVFPVVLRFTQSVRGLAVGAPLDFRGLEVGRVRSIDLSYDRVAGDFNTVVTVDVSLSRLARTGMPTRDEELRARWTERMAALVKRGLRAQLRSDSLLTGQLYIALDFFEKADPVAFDPKADPPVLPTVPGDLEALYAQIRTILDSLGKVPFDTLGQDLHAVLTRLEGTLGRLDKALARTDREVLPEVRDTLGELRRTVETLHGSVAPDAPLSQDMRSALRGLTDAARSLKSLADTLDRQPESLLRGRSE